MANGISLSDLYSKQKELMLSINNKNAQNTQIQEVNIPGLNSEVGQVETNINQNKINQQSQDQAIRVIEGKMASSGSSSTATAENPAENNLDMSELDALQQELDAAQLELTALKEAETTLNEQMTKKNADLEAFRQESATLTTEVATLNEEVAAVSQQIGNVQQPGEANKSNSTQNQNVEGVAPQSGSAAQAELKGLVEDIVVSGAEEILAKKADDLVEAGLKKAGKATAKGAVKTVAKGAAKMLPGVGMVMELGEAAKCASQGDIKGAAFNVLDAVVGEIPYVGDALSIIGTENLYDAATELGEKAIKKFKNAIGSWVD